MHRILDPAAQNQVAHHLCALAIMTKAPRPGTVKTRLVPPLTDEEAAQLNVALLQDLSHSISRATQMSPSSGVAVYTPRGAEQVYTGILPGGFFLLPQRGDAFGERLILAAEDLFRIGYGSVCLINSDSPTVPTQNFAEAAIELADPRERVVLGPSEDGGYYLIGMKRMHRRLFEDIDWSTERVLTQTKARAAELGLRVHELAPGFDVDDAQSLARLCSEVLSMDPAATTDLVPNTRAFLKKIRQRL